MASRARPRAVGRREADRVGWCPGRELRAPRFQNPDQGGTIRCGSGPLEPDGKVVVNPTGNSGLGKAGNGDTLTGVLAGFMAQAVQMKIDVFDAVVAGVYMSALAGDVAAEKFGKRVMTASDVRECMADVFSLFCDQDAE